MRKKFLAILVVCCALFSIHTTSLAITQSEFNNRIAEQKAAYPHGSRWTGSFDGGIQCFGFAHMMAYNVFGSKANTWSKVYSLNDVKAGDVVQFGNTSGNGHTVFVLSVSGDAVTYVDCNSDYNCTVKWGGTFSKSANKIWSYTFSYLYSSPGVSIYADIGDDFYALISSPHYVGMYFTNESGNISIKKYNGTGNQIWHFSRTPECSYRIMSYADQKCIEVAGVTEGSNVQVYENNGSDAQRWYISGTSPNYTFLSKRCNYVADIAGYGNDGDKIHLWTSNNSNNQKFAIEKIFLNNPVLVTFETNGGHLSTYSMNAYFETNYGTLPSPTKSGHTFNGWYDDNKNLITSSTQVKTIKAHTLYAQWEVATPKIDSVVTKSGTAYTIKTTLSNISTACEIIAIGYKGGQLVSIQKKTSFELDEPFTLSGDIDEVKVMAWNSLSGLEPQCEAEVIPESEFITE